MQQHARVPRSIAAIILTIGPDAMSTTVSARPITADDDPCHVIASPLHVRLIADAGTDAEILAQAMREVEQIWSAAGLDLTWMTPHTAPELLKDRQPLTVVIRPAVTPHGMSATRGTSRCTTLGQLLFQNGHPTNYIEVSLGEITSLVMAASYGSRHVAEYPIGLQRILIGRAMGRVISHEIGHWLFGSAHTLEGLMRPRLNSYELVNPQPPTLPRAWRCHPLTTTIQGASSVGTDPGNAGRSGCGQNASRL
jgi:hypothetical protein